MLIACAKRLFLFLLLASAAWGQGFYHYENILLNQGGQPIVGVSVWVCTGNVSPLFSGNPPCTLASVFSDQAGSLPITQPITTSPLGNYGFYIASPTTVTVAFTGNGISNGSDVLTIPVVSGSAGTTATNLAGPGTISGTFSGTHTETGNVTFQGSNIHSGTETFTGVLQPKNLENVKYVDVSNSQGWSGSDLAGWIASAFASCTNSACTVWVANGSYATPAASITVGVSPCVNYPGTQAQTLIFDTGVQFTINNPIKVLCGGYLSYNGMNTFDGTISAGASLGTNPMVDVGDATNGAINAGVSYMRLNCLSRTGCSGIRVRGTNDLSYIEHNLIQNYAVNGLLMDGSVSNTGNTSIFDNLFGAATGGGNGIELNSVGEARFDRNSVVSSSGAAISAVCFHMGGTLSPNNSNLLNFHCENFTDAVLVDGAAGLNIVGLDPGGSPATTNGLHIASGATGVVTCLGCGDSGGTLIVKNDITSNNIAVAAGQHGQIPRYSWSGSSNTEEWVDTNGLHILTPNGNTFFAGASTVRFQNTGATEDGRIAMDAFAVGQLGIGTTTAHPVSLYTNGARRLNLQSDGGVGFTEIAAPAGTGGFDVCYGDSTAHALKCNYNNGTFGQVPLGGANLLMSPTAPTIAGAGCGGTVAAISAPNGTASFNLFTGTAPTSGGCTITMPTATTDWHCEANHVSAISTTNFIIQQTGALSTTSVTLQLFSDIAAATAPAASDTWRVTCTAN